MTFSGQNILILNWFPVFMGDNLETRKHILTLKAVILAVIVRLFWSHMERSDTLHMQVKRNLLFKWKIVANSILSCLGFPLAFEVFRPPDKSA